MITDKDITKLKSVFATKDDFKSFAKKEDLNRFATKEDLDKSEIRTAKSFEDVQKQIFRLEDDVSGLKKDVSSIKKDISGIKRDVSNLQEDVTDIKHNILTMEDNILGAINKLQVENSITATYRPRIENHEQRITKLEKLQFAS